MDDKINILVRKYPLNLWRTKNIATKAFAYLADCETGDTLAIIRRIGRIALRKQRCIGALMPVQEILDIIRCWAGTGEKLDIMLNPRKSFRRVFRDLHRNIADLCVDDRQAAHVSLFLGKFVTHKHIGHSLYTPTVRIIQPKLEIGVHTGPIANSQIKRRIKEAWIKPAVHEIKKRFADAGRIHPTPIYKISGVLAFPALHHGTV